jgi:hypothetical protein
MVRSAGVITSWYFHDGSSLVSNLKLKVGRLSLAGATIVGDSVAPALRYTNNMNGPFATRIPVQAGDYIGIYTSGTGNCSLSTTNASDTFVNAVGDLAPGVTAAVSLGTSFKFPVDAIVEADADSDGFGDETQDFCSSDAATQGPCRPGSVVFGSQDLTTLSPTKFVTLSNTAPTPLSISSILASGDFTITLNDCGSFISAFSSCTVGLAFQPTAAGPQTGTLSIADAANGSPHTIPLNGTGTAGPTGTAAKCIVPKLRGKRLRIDRKALNRADCALGKVKGQRSKKAKVKKQSPKPGAVLPAGSKVNVTLG